MRNRELHDNPIITAGTATLAGLGAFVFPVWWPSIEQLGLWAAPLVPILSVIWLALQSVNMVSTWIEKRRNRK